jgi:hypothetical protein
MIFKKNTIRKLKFWLVKRIIFVLKFFFGDSLAILINTGYHIRRSKEKGLKTFANFLAFVESLPHIQYDFATFPISLLV